MQQVSYAYMYVKVPLKQQNLVQRLGTSIIHIVGLASFCSKTVVMLLLIHWLLLLSLFVGGCEWSLFCYALLSVLSFMQSSGQGRKSWLL